jgi:hypothetical protein
LVYLKMSSSRSSRSRRTPFVGGGSVSGAYSSYGLGPTSSSGYASFSSAGYSPSSYSSSYLTGGSSRYSTAPVTTLSPSAGYTGSSSSKYGGYASLSSSPMGASSPYKRYAGAKTDTELTNGSSGGGGSSPWRSKSSDPMLTNGYHRERSLSRDPSSYYSALSDNTAAAGYRSSVGRETSARSTVRDYSASRDYRAGSLTDMVDGGLLPPPRSAKKSSLPPSATDYLYHSTPPPTPRLGDTTTAASRFSNATAAMYSTTTRPSLSRSNSFHDLREASGSASGGLASPLTPRARCVFNSSINYYKPFNGMVPPVYGGLLEEYAKIFISHVMVQRRMLLDEGNSQELQRLDLYPTMLEKLRS